MLDGTIYIKQDMIANRKLSVGYICTLKWLPLPFSLITISKSSKKLAKILTPLVEVLLTKLINLCEEAEKENAM